jgi:hypothetical protein
LPAVPVEELDKLMSEVCQLHLQAQPERLAVEKVKEDSFVLAALTAESTEEKPLGLVDHRSD